MNFGIKLQEVFLFPLPSDSEPHTGPVTDQRKGPTDRYWIPEQPEQPVISNNGRVVQIDCGGETGMKLKRPVREKEPKQREGCWRKKGDA